MSEINKIEASFVIYNALKHRDVVSIKELNKIKTKILEFDNNLIVDISMISIESFIRTCSNAFSLGTDRTSVIKINPDYDMLYADYFNCNFMINDELQEIIKNNII